MQPLPRIVALCTFLAAPAWALPPAQVEAVQMPAWIERDGRIQPLAVAMEVRNGDRIRTGGDARVYLKLAEGSTVKLGADAQLTLFSRSLKPQSQFKGALDVLTGAFRFTTAVLGRVKSREVMIRVGTATAGIRGTDVWGRANPKEDLVCLIEGQIEIKHAAMAEPLAMTVPMSVFVAPRGAAPQPVAAVDPVLFRGWARETEIEAGDGAARPDGKRRLLLGSHDSEAAALAQYDQARSAGFAARVMPHAAAAGGWSYDVELTGFRDGTDAARAAVRLKTATGIAAVPR